MIYACEKCDVLVLQRFENAHC